MFYFTLTQQTCWLAKWGKPLLKPEEYYPSCCCPRTGCLQNDWWQQKPVFLGFQGQETSLAGMQISQAEKGPFLFWCTQQILQIHHTFRFYSFKNMLAAKLRNHMALSTIIQQVTQHCPMCSCSCVPELFVQWDLGHNKPNCFPTLGCRCWIFSFFS